MKTTHVWTSMDYWVPKGTQADGTGRCRGRCPFGSIGGNWKWVHEWSIVQESHRLKAGKGRKPNKGAAPLGLHKETCKAREDRYKAKKT